MVREIAIASRVHFGDILYYSTSQLDYMRARLVTCSVCLFPYGLDSGFECVSGLTQLKILFAPSSMVSVETRRTFSLDLLSMSGILSVIQRLDLLATYL
jgi:hypothetical protein